QVQVSGQRNAARLSGLGAALSAATVVVQHSSYRLPTGLHAGIAGRRGWGVSPQVTPVSAGQPVVLQDRTVRCIFWAEKRRLRSGGGPRSGGDLVDGGLALGHNRASLSTDHRDLYVVLLPIERFDAARCFPHPPWLYVG